MGKSITLAYILWFFLGFTGVHLFYLRRDKHAFFNSATLGGVFGIGTLRDLFYIPKYVAEANESREYMEDLNDKMRKKDRPPMSTPRFIAIVLMGYLLAFFLFIALWTEGMSSKHTVALTIAAHFFAAIGVWFMTNEGRTQVEFFWCFIGSMLPIYLTLQYGHDQLLYGSLVSGGFACGKSEWRRTPQSSGFCKRVFILTTCGLLYTGLVGAAIYYNASITTNGEKVLLREAVQNFFKSPAWRETKDTLYRMFEYYKHHGWRQVWEEFKESLDPRGETNAYQVLDLNSTATQEEIKATYKKLARQWHPDKVKDPEKKKQAQEKFMEIQEAYDILSNIKQGRSKQNKKTQSRSDL